MVTKVIKKGGTPGVDCDYNTVQSWYDDAPSTLTDVWRGEITAGSEWTYSGQLLNANSKTTSASYYFELTTASGQSFRDHANKATNALKYNSSNGVAFRQTGGWTYVVPIVLAAPSNHFRLSNLQFCNDDGNTSAILMDTSSISSTNEVLVDYCIFEAQHQTLSAYYGCKFRNSLFVMLSSGANIAAGLAEFYNCTIVNPSDNSSRDAFYASSAATVKNCAIFGGAIVASSTTFTTCKTDQSSPPTGFGSAITYADQFESVATSGRDFRVKSGAGLIDAGTTDSTNAANDIIGTARPSGSGYDVGSWEYVSGGGSSAPKRNLLLRVG